MRVAEALVNKAITLGDLGRSRLEQLGYDEVVNRFAEADEQELREVVALARANRDWPAAQVHGLVDDDDDKPERADSHRTKAPHHAPREPSLSIGKERLEKVEQYMRGHREARQIEIANALRLNGGSVSVALRLLEKAGKVEKVGRVGTSRSYVWRQIGEDGSKEDASGMPRGGSNVGSWPYFEERCQPDQIAVARDLWDQLKRYVDERQLDWKPARVYWGLGYKRKGSYAGYPVAIYLDRKPVEFSVELMEDPAKLGRGNPYPDLNAHWHPARKEWTWAVPSTSPVPDVGLALDISVASLARPDAVATPQRPEDVATPHIDTTNDAIRSRPRLELIRRRASNRYGRLKKRGR